MEVNHKAEECTIPGGPLRQSTPRREWAQMIGVATDSDDSDGEMGSGEQPGMRRKAGFRRRGWSASTDVGGLLVVSRCLASNAVERLADAEAGTPRGSSVPHRWRSGMASSWCSRSYLFRPSVDLQLRHPSFLLWHSPVTPLGSINSLCCSGSSCEGQGQGLHTQSQSSDPALPSYHLTTGGGRPLSKSVRKVALNVKF